MAHGIPKETVMGVLNPVLKRIADESKGGK
jgi:hypothetical protein